MFGGLEVKGTDKPASASASAAQPAAAPASSFSFLNATVTPPPPAAAAAPGSGFSFLNTSAPAAPVEDAAPSAAQQSAFSFMGAAGGAPTAQAAASRESDAAAPSNTASSSFSFMSQVPPLASEQQAAANALNSEKTTPSGFGFLTSTTTTVSGGGDTVSTLSRDSPVLSDPGMTLGGASAMDTFAPTGSGVVFGGAAPQPKAVKKKRNRTARIGSGAVAGVATNTTTMSRPTTIPTPSSTTSSSTTNAANGTAAATREAASEALKRAEEFMNQKLQQQAAATVILETKDTDEEELRNNKASPSSFQPVSQSGSKSDDDDSIVRAAKAAAKDAQELLAHPPQRTLGDRMGLGGFFRHATHRSSPPGQQGSSSHSTEHAAKKEEEMTPAERLQREQEQVKRAMAERQLQMMKQRKQQDTAEALDGKEEGPYRAISGTFEPPVPPQTSLDRAHSIAAMPSQFTPAPPQHIIMVPKVKAPPAPTPTDQFHAILDAFRQKVICSMQEVTRLRQHRSGLLEERFVTMAKERLAVQQKAQAEAQQMAAAESEDFELADRMGTLIDNHEAERIEVAAILENIGRALDQLDSQKDELVEDVTKCFNDIEKKLKDFQKEQESLESNDAAEAMQRFSAESRQLSAENERLQHDSKMLNRDADLVAEERKELELAISEQAGEFEKLRDDAKQKLEVVESEIEELRKQLEAKQKVAAELRTESAGHDESILKVRVKFSRQLARVQKKESTIRESREDWEMEKLSYDSQRAEHNKKVETHSEVMLARDQLLDSLGTEVEMAATFGEIVAKELGLGVLPNEDKGEDNELAQMQADTVKCEAAVREAKEVLKTAAAGLSNLEEEIKTLEFSIPILEDTKNAAAARRDFKGAGKASKEIKEATARLKECQEELIEEANERQTKAEEEVKKLESQLELKRKVAHEKERETSIAAMHRLADNIRRLVATKASVCGDAEERSIKGVGAFVLDSQIKALQVEGQTYGDKYGVWDELVADIELEDPQQAQGKGDSLGDEEEIDNREGKAMDQEPETAKDTPDENADDTKPIAEEEKLPLEERLSQFRELTSRLKETEDALEQAVAAEDYEKADEIDKVLQEILAGVESLSLTDSEMETALTGDEPVAEAMEEAEELEEAQANAEPEAASEPKEDYIVVDEDAQPQVPPASSEECQPDDTSPQEDGDEKDDPVLVENGSTTDNNKEQPVIANGGHASDSKDESSDVSAALTDDDDVDNDDL